MERTREEILPGIWLTAIETDKFKNDLLSISLLTSLKRETAACNTLVFDVLRRGSSAHPDLESIAAALDELYGASIFPVSRRFGEIQALGLAATFAGSDYVPGGGKVLEKAFDLLCELLLSPATRGGFLLPEYVDSEREKLLQKIRARKNDKGSYAILRLIENMCAYEDFSVFPLGSEEEAETIRHRPLTKRYRELLAESPVEVFYCGCAPFRRVAGALRVALGSMPRGEIDYDIGTEIRMNSVEEQPRIFDEELDVTQGKLAIGWRLGDCMEEPDVAAIRVFNAVFGGCVTSKLFMNVREKLSLCYYASSAVDINKGLLYVSSGIEFSNYEAARDEIFAQLEAIKRGEVSEDELSAARRSVVGSLRSYSDEPGSLEGYWLNRAIDGFDCSPEELAALCEEVSLEDVVAIANSVECDAIYFLHGKEAEDE